MSDPSNPSEVCVYCHRGDPPPQYGFRCRCRACGREYLAPFPAHGAAIADTNTGPISPMRPIPPRPVYHFETSLAPVPKPAIAPEPRAASTGPQSALEFD